MGVLSDPASNADVICQHSRDGSIIPLKIRILDEDGAYQTYVIRSYRLRTHSDTYTTPDDITATNHTWRFECHISVLGRDRLIQLFYNSYDNNWRVIY